MKKTVIIPNVNKDEGLAVTSRVVSRMTDLGFELYVHEEIARSLDGVIAYSSFPSQADLIVVIGGDGTVIDASVDAIRFDVPILGVNLGRVGYLTEVEPDDLDALDELARGNYSVSSKMLLEISCNSEICGNHRFAVNDIVISHNGYLGISNVGLEDSVGNSVRYRADGIILSTPQGSTAYSLSAGGPIVARDVESIIATPVCAHSFFNRSVVFNSSEQLRITNIGSDDLAISMDGRYASKLPAGDTCVVQKSRKVLKMISFAKNSMFTNLFRKMKMLEDNGK